MAAYSLDLRKRVLRAWDSGLGADSVAAKYDVSRAWVHRLVQRRRETGCDRCAWGAIPASRRDRIMGHPLTYRHRALIVPIVSMRSTMPSATRSPRMRSRAPRTWRRSASHQAPPGGPMRGPRRRRRPTTSTSTSPSPPRAATIRSGSRRPRRQSRVVRAKTSSSRRSRYPNVCPSSRCAAIARSRVSTRGRSAAGRSITWPPRPHDPPRMITRAVTPTIRILARTDRSTFLHESPHHAARVVHVPRRPRGLARVESRRPSRAPRTIRARV